MKEFRIVRAGEALKVPQDWGELTWFANAKLANSDSMTVGKCVIRRGRENPLHSHPNCDEILTVVDGTISHRIGDGKYMEMQPGDTITVPVGSVHHARNTGTSDAVLFIAFSSADRQTRGE